MDRLITLGVGTVGAEDYLKAFKPVSALAQLLGREHNYLNVTVQVIDDDPVDEQHECDREDLYYDENTLIKVRSALKKVLDYVGVEAAINELQNAGILFRERPKTKGE